MIVRALHHYGKLDAATLSDWLMDEYIPDHFVVDPIAAYLETEFPGLVVNAGLTRVTFVDGEDKAVVPILEWHDLLLAKIVNGATSRDALEQGFRNVDGGCAVRVWRALELLSARPVSPVEKYARKVWSALKSAFRTEYEPMRYTVYNERGEIIAEGLV